MLPVLFQDEHLVAVHKPAGLLVHRTSIDSRERRFALQLVRDQLGRRVHLVHRLDKGTSGILVLALDAETARGLGAAFEGREVDKRYLAVVRGWPEPEGVIDYALGAVEDPYERATPSSAPQPALTRFRRLATVELPVRVDRYPTSRYSLLELEPVTGRRHQLRWHLHHVSHPVIGDTTYGNGGHNRLFRERFGCARMLLACVNLRFRHPVTGRPVHLDAPVEGEFARVLDALGWTELRYTMELQANACM